MNPYKELANAIIVQAVKDYRTALNQLSLNPNDKAAQSEKKSIEAFFVQIFSPFLQISTVRLFLQS